MREGRRRGRFLCLGMAADAVADEDEAMERSNSTRSTGGRRQKPLRRILSGIVRSVSAQDRCGKTRAESRAVESLANKSVPNSHRKSTDNVDRRLLSSSSTSSSASTSSLLSSASSSSSSCFSSEPKLLREKAPPPPPVVESRRSPPARRRYDSANGIWLLLVSLFVMVFCGRICAILWTSMWLCLVLRQNPDVTPPERGVAVEDTPELRPKVCDEYQKKRVVLEGLLERNRSRTV